MAGGEITPSGEAPKMFRIADPSD